MAEVSNIRVKNIILSYKPFFLFHNIEIIRQTKKSLGFEKALFDSSIGTLYNF